MNKRISLLAILAVATITTFGGGTNASCLGTGSSCSENVTVEVEILPGDICIGTTGSFDFGQYTVSSSAQTQNGTFSDPFWVEDLKGSDTGYYTTVQLSGDLVGPGTATIAAANVSIKVPSTATTTLAGTANAGVVLPSGLLSFTALNSAVTFINRAIGVNNGVIGKYGTLPEMQVVIPAYQSVGNYVATLVYTIYEN